MATTNKENITTINNLINILEIIVGLLAMFIILVFLQCSIGHF